MSTRAAQLGFRPRPLPPARLERHAPAALDPLRARAIALLPLALYGALRWGHLVAPAGGAHLLIGLGLGLALVLLARRPLDLLHGRVRILAGVVAALGSVVVVLLAAGVRSRLLAPSGLDALWSGLNQGISNLPGADVPYHGADPWARIVILLGGELLVVAGVWAGLRARESLSRRTLAALPLVVLVAVPMVVVPARAPVLQGLIVFVLLAAFLWLERLSRADLAAAAWLAALAAVVGAAAAPALDRNKPWVNYEALAQSLATAHAEKFDWTQRYGPIDWPRESREVLRVQVPHRTYVKAENLDGFDGLHWFRTTDVLDQPSSQLPTPVPRKWLESVRVTVRSMSSEDLLSAGLTLAVSRLDQGIIPAGSPGTWTTDSKLARGDSYLTTSYYPRPTAAQLRGAGTAYPGTMSNYMEISLPARRGAGWTTGPQSVLFGFWGQHVEPVVSLPTQGPAPTERSDAQLRAGPYAQVWALSLRLAAGSRTAYDYTRAVLRYLGNGFTYDESPPARPVPLAAFLTTDRKGYCQQFAGAMALLLRMGGVPARVVTGFSPGAYDRPRGEWVIRDYDAHAWVEAWFPNAGWVTFDPTPSVAPALSGPKFIRRPHGAAAPGGLDIGRRPGGRAHSGSGSKGGTAVLWLVVIGAVALILIAWIVVRVRRRAPVTDPVLAELERALRMTGRPPQPPLTLSQLERRLRTSPGAAAYVGALRDARFGFGATAITAAQRRALREELSRGLGVAGRLRALWALPPRPAVRRR
jgi:transglutaminase-like putative cysteine protease